MASWSEIEQAAPELAADVTARFNATGLAMLATLRKDGSPRISGIEPLFSGGEVWLGMMDNSRKKDDVDRDPRLALHAATIDKDVKEGDAKLTGRAVLVDDDETFEAFRAAFEAHTGNPAPPGRFPLYRVDVKDVSILRPAGDHLDIRWWSEKDGLKQLDRY